ncbi:MAG: glycosyltransferase family 39 protein [Candidatus Hydrogenedentota bacterium]
MIEKADPRSDSNDSVIEGNGDIVFQIDPRLVTPILFCILLFAFAIRMWLLPQESLWYDEIATMDHLDQPTFGQFLDALRKQNPKVPPVYLGLEYYWAKFIDGGQISLRFMSLIPAMLSIYLGFLVLRKIHSPEAGLLTAYLMAASSTHVFYSLEIRMYSLLLMLLLFSIYAYFSALETKNRGWWIAHILATTVIVFTHQLGLLILPCLAIHAYFFGFKSWRTRIIWTACHTVAVLTILPWLFTINTDNLGGDYHYMSAPHILTPGAVPDPNIPSIQNMLFSWTTPPAHWNNTMIYQWTGTIGTVLLTIGNALVMGLYSIGAGLVLRNLSKYFRNRTDPVASGHLIFLASLFFVPGTLLFLLSYLWVPCFIYRYLQISLFAMMACLVVSLLSLSNVKLRYGMIALLLIGTTLQIAVDGRVSQRGSWSIVISRVEAEPHQSPRLHLLAQHEEQLRYADAYLNWNKRDSELKKIPYFSFSDLEKYLLVLYAAKRIDSEYNGDVILALSPEDRLQLTDYLDKYQIAYTVDHIFARDYMDYVRLNPPPLP